MVSPFRKSLLTASTSNEICSPYSRNSLFHSSPSEWVVSKTFTFRKSLTHWRLTAISIEGKQNYLVFIDQLRHHYFILSRYRESITDRSTEHEYQSLSTDIYILKAEPNWEIGKQTSVRSHWQIDKNPSRWSSTKILTMRLRQKAEGPKSEETAVMQQLRSSLIRFQKVSRFKLNRTALSKFEI